MPLYSNDSKEFTIHPGCPWYEAQQSFGPPNVNWCEETQCSVISEPINTWSNLGFLFISLWILISFKRRSPMLFQFALVVLVMGLLSLIYHATNNYLTQFFDFTGMALMASYLLAFNVKRLKPNWSFGSLFWFFVFFDTFLFAFFGITNVPVQMIIFINFGPVVVLELINGWREQRFRDYGFFALAVVSLVAAQVASAVDLKRVICSPEGWIHGHAVWHLLCAVAMGFTALHLKRMSDPR